MIHQPWSELAGFIRRHDAGWLVDVGDGPGLRAALDEIIDQPDRLAARSARAQELSRQELAWDRAVAPLDRFLAQPRRQRPENPTLHLRVGRPSLGRVAGRLARALLQSGPAGLWRAVSGYLKAPRD